MCVCVCLYVYWQIMFPLLVRLAPHSFLPASHRGGRIALHGGHALCQHQIVQATFLLNLIRQLPAVGQGKGIQLPKAIGLGERTDEG